MSFYYLLVRPSSCESTRRWLSALGRLSSEARCVGPLACGRMAIPVAALAGEDAEALSECLERELGASTQIVISTPAECGQDRQAVEVGRRPSPHSAKDEIASQCMQILRDLSLWDETLRCEIPARWEKHTDLALLPEKSFVSAAWSHERVGDRVWVAVCRALGVSRLARKAAIANDDYRSPRVTLLYGFKDGGGTWARRVDNGIEYNWNITRSMFSIGNIGEKMRMAELDCRGQTVVDLFAGIGYFTLPLLVHAKAAVVHACEWNEAAANALQLNLSRNGVEADRCTIHRGDNRLVCPAAVADRVILGLIPSAEGSYEVACRALKAKTGGILHVHANVEITKEREVSLAEGISASEAFVCKQKAWEWWSIGTAIKIRDLLNACQRRDGVSWRVSMQGLAHVKSYAPKIDHVVLDLQCIPENKDTY